jgi:hypothetical protein
MRGAILPLTRMSAWRVTKLITRNMFNLLLLFLFQLTHLHLLEKPLGEDHYFLSTAHINQNRGPRTTDLKQTTR